MRKGNSNFKKNKEDYVLLFFLIVVMVVLNVAIFKSNLEVIPERIPLIKEKSIHNFVSWPNSMCSCGEKFSSHLIAIPAKSSEIPPNCILQRLRMCINDFFNLVLVCKDIEPRNAKIRTRDFFSTLVSLKPNFEEIIKNH